MIAAPTYTPPQGMHLDAETPEAFSAWVAWHEALVRRELQIMDTMAPLDIPDMLISFWDYLGKKLVLPESVSCTEGCSACCHGQHVAALIPEVILLSRAVVCEPPAVRHEIIGEVRAAATRIQGTTRARRAQLRVPCGLLTREGACAAYALRPAACRGENSVDDPRLCDDPRGRHRRMAEQFQQFTTARYVAAERLAARGLDARFVELSLGLALTFEDESAIPRWAQGDHTAFEEVSLPYPYTVSMPMAQRAGRRLPLYPERSHR